MRKLPPPTTPGAIVGAAVRELRQLRGWTLERLSEETDISVSGLSQLETGKCKRIRRANVTRLAMALSVAETELDPSCCAARVATEATTLKRRRLVDAVLSLPSEFTGEAEEVLAELIARSRRSKT